MSRDYLKSFPADREAVKREVDRLVTRLDDDRFTERQAAYGVLFAKIRDYYDVLYVKQSDAMVSTEVRAQIKKLLSSSLIDEPSYMQSIVSVLRLTDDVNYLNELKSVSNEEQVALIDRYLETLSLARRESSE